MNDEAMNAYAENVAAPTVSVLMPVYNCALYVEEAIRSVMVQTYTDWELIVIDDGSTDNTRTIVQRLSDEDARVRLICNPANMGVAKTRNRGLDLCGGQYVALLDGDDRWYPTKLEKQLTLAEETEADVIYCSYGMEDENSEKLCEDFIVPEETDYRRMLVQSVISCSTALLSRRVADTYRFRTDFYHEDLVLWLEMLRDGHQARGVTEVLAVYRVARGSRASNKLKSAVERFKIYHNCLGEPLLQCVRCIVEYAFLATKKYKKCHDTRREQHAVV